MRDVGLLLLIGGVVMTVVGAAIYFFGGIPFFGKLPGDIRSEGKNVSVYIPITTCIVLSIVLTLVMTFISRLR